MPREASRPSEAVAAAAGDEGLLQRVRDAEARVYEADEGPDRSWRTASAPWLSTLVASAGFQEVSVEVTTDAGALRVTEALVERWTGPAAPYATALAAALPAEDLRRVRAAIGGLVGREALPWRTATAYIVARAPGDP
jgi:hypothetical protein